MFIVWYVEIKITPLWTLVKNIKVESKDHFKPSKNMLRDFQGEGGILSPFYGLMGVRG